MGIDINLFRKEKGGDPDKIKESEKKRFKKQEDIDRVDVIIDLDKEWRGTDYKFNKLNQKINSINKEIGKAKKAKKECDNLIKEVKTYKDEQDQLEKLKAELGEKLKIELRQVGNILHESVIVTENEEDAPVVRKWGEIPKMVINSTPGFAHHHEVLSLIDGYDPKRGSKVSGHRGYFLKGWGAILNMALINYGLHYLMKREYTPLHTPFFMKKSVMAETCQLNDFDDQLYKVSTGKNSDSDNIKDFYLIATSEQPISAYFYNEVIDPEELPIKFGGYSTCFRKEAGAHGKDTWGIFRIHQFEKIEQFVITEPENSWDELERMVKTAEEFYQSLKLPYRVINIVSGDMNDAAAKKYDLEAWFPGYGAYRELVSASNCTDFQSRGLNVKMHPKKNAEINEKRYVHMLNATLCATERTLCCILENYQTPEGVIVPEVLRKYVGEDFIPYDKDKLVEFNELAEKERLKKEKESLKKEKKAKKKMDKQKK